MVDVVGLGCCCFDLLGVVPHMPGADEEIRMLETRQQGGGEVATALVTLARLGCSVACAGKVGDDAFGNSIRRELDQYGVDTRNLLVEPGALSQASVVLVDRASGQRSILACVPTFGELLPSQLPPDGPGGQGCRWCWMRTCWPWKATSPGCCAGPTS